MAKLRGESFVFRKKNYWWFALIAAILIFGSAFIVYFKVKKNLDVGAPVVSEPSGGDDVYTLAQNGSDASVLFISSYSQSFITVDEQRDGVIEVLDENNVHLDTEYMDTKNYDSEEWEELFFEEMQYKIGVSGPYDAILLGDDAALKFAMKYQAELFENTPMVFFCVNDEELASEAVENPLITGFTEQFDVEKTIEIAEVFQPNATRVVALVDDTLTGVGDKDSFLKLASNFPQFEFETINSSELTTVELSARLSEIDESTIFIYYDRFEDSEGNRFTIDDTAHYLHEHIAVPIYRASAGGVGKGVLGGYMFSYQSAGRTAAAAVVSILDGAPISELQDSENSDSFYVFDCKIIEEFNMDESLIPEQSILINHEQTFLEKNGIMLIPLVSVSLFLLVLLIATIIDSRMQSRYKEELEMSHNALKETYNKLRDTEKELEHKYQENREYTNSLEEKETRIKFQADHDYLTGLFNRRASMEYLNNLLENGNELTVMLMDIDDFKSINDTDGHTSGDIILKDMANRLSMLAEKEGVYVGRFGGDEFLLIYNETNVTKINLLISKVRSITSQAFFCNGKQHFINISIGIVNSIDIKTDKSEVISYADLAMYATKRTGKNSYAFYDSTMKSQIVNEADIKASLINACKNDGFTVLYQPQINAATGLTDGYEALARLKDNSYSPSAFIPVAEQSDLIITIGRIITKKVIEQMASWQEHGLKLKPVAINFSSKQLLDSGYIDFLSSRLRINGIDPSLIEIEITESIFLSNSDKAMKLLNDFKSIGIKLTLDDFGTGYSSINYLTYIPIGRIKLDKVLADAYLVDGKDNFVDNLIRLVHCLGLKITVEGIEAKNQCDKLKEFSCDNIQGFYFSKPLSGDDIEHSEFR